MKEYYEGGEINWVVSGDVHKKQIWDCDKKITTLGQKNSNAKILPKDSVLIALNGQGKTRGTVAMLRIEATCNQSIVCMSPKDRKAVQPEYLFYYLEGLYKDIREITGDKDRRGLNMPILRGIRIPLAPPSEQHRIVAILDEALEAISSTKASAERNLQNARAVFEIYLNEVFSRRGHGWVESRLGDLAEVQSGGTPSVARREYWGGNIPWYSSGELNELFTTDPERHVTAAGLDSSNAKLFPEGSLLIGMYDTAAR